MKSNKRKLVKSSYKRVFDPVVGPVWYLNNKVLLFAGGHIVNAFMLGTLFVSRFMKNGNKLHR